MTAPPDRQIEALLDEALAQYRAHPSDYLEGTVTGTDAHADPRTGQVLVRIQAKDRNAGTRPATARLRDYLNGNQAAIMWVTGGSTSPPIQFVLADNPPPTQGTQQ